MACRSMVRAHSVTVRTPFRRYLGVWPCQARQTGIPVYNIEQAFQPSFEAIHVLNLQIYHIRCIVHVHETRTNEGEFDYVPP
jgi:hypothetical protein